MTPRSLLLIDADPAVHQQLTGLLQREDRELQHIADGREALNVLRAVVNVVDVGFVDRDRAVDVDIIDHAAIVATCALADQQCATNTLPG